jgi:predicted kinase
MDSEGRRDDNEERIFQQHTRKRSIDLAERKHFRYQKYRRSDEEEEAVVVPDIVSF